VAGGANGDGVAAAAQQGLGLTRPSADSP